MQEKSQMCLFHYGRRRDSFAALSFFFLLSSLAHLCFFFGCLIFPLSPSVLVFLVLLLPCCWMASPCGQKQTRKLSAHHTKEEIKKANVNESKESGGGEDSQLKRPKKGEKDMKMGSRGKKQGQFIPWSLQAFRLRFKAMSGRLHSYCCSMQEKARSAIRGVISDRETIIVVTGLQTRRDSSKQALGCVRAHVSRV